MSLEVNLKTFSDQNGQKKKKRKWRKKLKISKVPMKTNLIPHNSIKIYKIPFLAFLISRDLKHQVWWMGEQIKIMDTM